MAQEQPLSPPKLLKAKTKKIENVKEQEKLFNKKRSNPLACRMEEIINGDCN